MLPTSLAGACWYLLPPVLLVHDFQHSIGRQPPHGVVAPPVCCLPLFCLQIICLSILVCGHLSHFYHPFMDSVFFFPWEFPFTFICGFVCFSLCGHYLKVCGPTHLRLVAGRVSAIHDLTPDLMLVWGLGKLLMSHILCGRFWVRILYDDNINLPKSQGRSPTLISVAIILYPNNTMTYYVVWYFYHLIGTTYDFICLSNEIGNKIKSRSEDQMIDCGRVCCQHYRSD